MTFSENPTRFAETANLLRQDYLGPLGPKKSLLTRDNTNKIKQGPKFLGRQRVILFVYIIYKQNDNSKKEKLQDNLYAKKNCKYAKFCFLLFKKKPKE